MNEDNPYYIPATESETPSGTSTPKTAWDTTRDSASDALETGERYVKDNPSASVLGFFLIGLLLGMLVGRSQNERSYCFARGLGRRW